MTDEKQPVVSSLLELGIRPWGWHAGNGTPAHPAEKVVQWPAHNRARMKHAVYTEDDMRALADQVLTLKTTLCKAAQ